MADGSKLSVILPRGFHPFPSRTRKLSPAEPMVLHAKVCGRLGRRRHKIKGRSWKHGRPFPFQSLLAELPTIREFVYWAALLACSLHSPPRSPKTPKPANEYHRAFSASVRDDR